MGRNGAGVGVGMGQVGWRVGGWRVGLDGIGLGIGRVVRDWRVGWPGLPGEECVGLARLARLAGRVGSGEECVGLGSFPLRRLTMPLHTETVHTQASTPSHS